MSTLEVRELDARRAIVRLAGRLTTQAVPPEAERDLLSAFRSWKDT